MCWCVFWAHNTCTNIRFFLIMGLKSCFRRRDWGWDYWKGQRGWKG